MKKLEIDSFKDLFYISNPKFSPCGKFISYVVKKADMINNNYLSDLMLYSIIDHSTTQLTNLANVEDYIWTKNGELLYFNYKNNETFFYHISTQNQKEKSHYSVKMHVNTILELADGQFAFTADFQNKGHYDQTASYELIDEHPFWTNGKGYCNGERQRLYVFDSQKEILEAITGEWFDCESFVVDDHFIVYKGLEWRNIKTSNNQPGVYRYDIDTKQTLSLIEPYTLYIQTINCFTEQDYIITASYGEKYGPNEICDFYTLNKETKKIVLLQHTDTIVGRNNVLTDVAMGKSTTIKNSNFALYYVATKNEVTVMKKIDSHGIISDLTEKDGVCASFDVYDDLIVTCCMYANKVFEVYLNNQRISFLNDNFTEKYFISMPKKTSYTNQAGIKIIGFVMRPINYNPEKNIREFFLYMVGREMPFLPITIMKCKRCQTQVSLSFIVIQEAAMDVAMSLQILVEGTAQLILVT